MLAAESFYLGITFLSQQFRGTRKGLCLKPLSTIFQLYRGGQFIGGGNWNTRRKSTTCLKSLINFYHKMLNQVHLAMMIANR
jgi:hypothetical protein